MKTIVFWTRKRARKPKMLGLATAAGSVHLICNMAKSAAEGDGKLFIVDAPTADHGRRIIKAFQEKQNQDIGSPGIVFSGHDGRIVAIGVNAVTALSGAVSGMVNWDARLARQGRVYETQTRALTKNTTPNLGIFDIGR